MMGLGELLSLPLERGQSQARGVSPGKMVVVRLFQKVVEARSWLVMSAEAIRFGGGWQVDQMFVGPDLVLPSFFHPLTHSTNAEYQLCAWPEKTWLLPQGVLMKGPRQTITSFRTVA